MNNIEIRAFLEHFRPRDGIDICIFDGDSVATSVTTEPYKPGEVLKPLLSIDGRQAQVLMDDLWACGLRPTEGSGSAGSLAATERHLADMRKIVEKKLGVTL